MRGRTEQFVIADKYSILLLLGDDTDCVSFFCCVVRSRTGYIVIADKYSILLLLGDDTDCVSFFCCVVRARTEHIGAWSRRPKYKTYNFMLGSSTNEYCCRAIILRSDSVQRLGSIPIPYKKRGHTPYSRALKRGRKKALRNKSAELFVFD